MRALFPRPAEHAAIRTDLKGIFVSLELSHSTWVITSLAPGPSFGLDADGGAHDAPCGSCSDRGARVLRDDTAQRTAPDQCLSPLGACAAPEPAVDAQRCPADPAAGEGSGR